jgi:4a-hydroxytetrahydrobiopterin dehydratase
MTELTEQHCIPCKKGAPKLTPEQIHLLHPQVPEWNVVEQNGVKQLTREFSFQNFAEALIFTNLVGELAETQGHHPVLVTQWGKVTVTWWTHKIGGLHQNDFIMAAKTDQLHINNLGKSDDTSD